MNLGTDSQALALAEHYQLVNSDGRLDGTQTKSFTLTDGTRCTAQILGFRHDDLSDGSGKAGISWLFTDIVATHQWNPTNSNSGGWKASSLRAYMNGELYNLLPAELKAAIKPVDKFTNNVGVTPNVADSASITKTSDRLWALAVVEAWGYGDDYPLYNAEGSQYQLYEDAKIVAGSDEDHDGGGVHSALRKSGSGTSVWWLRTPSFDFSDCSCESDWLGRLWRHTYTIGSSGDTRCSAANGVVPGFCS